MKKAIVFSVGDVFFIKDIETGLLLDTDGQFKVPRKTDYLAVSFRLPSEARSYASMFGHEVVIEISNPQGLPENFDEKLRPLFEAMKQGRTIKRIICCRGNKYKFDRSKDFIMLNVMATSYEVNFMNYHDDYVHCRCDHSPVVKYHENHLSHLDAFQFYMGWVREFEL